VRAFEVVWAGDVCAVRKEKNCMHMCCAFRLANAETCAGDFLEQNSKNLLFVKGSFIIYL
jgi:hypothetical protein